MLAILIAIIIYYVYYAIAMLNYLSTKYLTVSKKSERKYKKIYNIIERENYEILSGIQRKIMEF